jgi:DNA polymerase V
MFSSRVESLAVMAQAIASHATRLGGKLRRQALGTDYVSIFYHTSEHGRGDGHHRSGARDGRSRRKPM